MPQLWLRVDGGGGAGEVLINHFGFRLLRIKQVFLSYVRVFERQPFLVVATSWLNQWSGKGFFQPDFRLAVRTDNGGPDIEKSQIMLVSIGAIPTLKE
jgi:hypothetical protein